MCVIGVDNDYDKDLLVSTQMVMNVPFDNPMHRCRMHTQQHVMVDVRSCVYLVSILWLSVFQTCA